MTDHIPRKAEPEMMDDLAEAKAYAGADFAEVNQAFVHRLLELTGPIQSARAIDLGSGPGDVAIRLVRARPAWHVTAVDGSKAMLELARQAIDGAGVGQSIRLMLADAKATSLPVASFDVVLANSILHHITETGAFWSEVQRLAAPAATVFVRDLVRPSSVAAARKIVRDYAAEESKLLQEEFLRSLLSAYSLAEVRGQLGDAGLDMLEAAQVTDRHLDVFGRLP